MGSMINRKEFIERTNEILEGEYKKLEDVGREVTFLLNCLLGLIVAVAEINKSEKKSVLNSLIDDEFLNLIPQKIGFVNNKNAVGKDKDLCSSPLILFDKPINHWNDLKEKKTKKWLIDKIRNSIAHLNIKTEPENGEIEAIRLWNQPFGKEYFGKKNFEIIFSIEELKNFALELSTRFLTEDKQRSV